MSLIAEEVMEPVNYENMSYEERRQWNINRNESILAMLFDGDKPKVLSDNQTHESNIYNEYMHDISSASAKYTCRENESERIKEYLSKVHINSLHNSTS